MKNVAVVLFNLGGPDSQAAIKPFLLNFFNDPNIIGAPQPLRGLIARYIAWSRSRRQAGSSYAQLGNCSPLLANTQVQADALAQALNGQNDGVRYQLHVCMRYWHPMALDVARAVKVQRPAQIILLPLYPQFSTTTTWSSLQAWQAAVQAVGLDVPTSMVCCYPEDTGFVAASADLVRQTYDQMRRDYPQAPGPRVLFSAHGLPEKVIKGGDPYQAQCEATAQAIAVATGIEKLDWMSCYQSRVGPLRWIGPSTEEAIKQAALDRVPILIYPHAFVSEHVETLVEIEHEYRLLAQRLGVPAFARVPTVMVHPQFIGGLAKMVQGQLGRVGIRSATEICACPTAARRCCLRMQVDLNPKQVVA